MKLELNKVFDFPTKLLYQRKLAEKEYDAQFVEFEMVKNNLAKKISILYYELVYLKNKEKIFISLDSLYGQMFAIMKISKIDLGRPINYKNY